MARLFDDGTTDLLLNANAVVSSYPFSMGGWMNTNDDGINEAIISIGDTATDNELWSLILRGDLAGDNIYFRSRDGGSNKNAITTSGITVDTWHHILGVGTNATDRKVYLDGGNVGSDAINSTPSGLDATAIGINVRDNSISPFSGLLAEMAIWNINLTAAEGAILAAGYSPLFVRPANLVAYWSLIRDTVGDGTGNDNDIVGGFTMAPVNTPTIGAHPRIIYPSQIWVPHKAVAAPGVTVPVMTYHYKQAGGL